jgi:integrase
VAKALNRFEIFTDFHDFKFFDPDRAVAFKRYLSEEKAQRSGKQLSKATLHSTLTQLARFFEWLAGQPGFKSRFSYSDAHYFNLSSNDTRIAQARREQKFPTVEQVKRVVSSMPAEREIERRDRALIAFAILTGARDSAIASAKLKHVDLITDSFCQDAREVKTKFRKTFTTFFFPVGSELRQIVAEWILYLREVKLWGNDDPLFPVTEVLVGASRQFEVSGLAPRHWKNASPIRKIFRDAFIKAGLSYFHPHSFRNTLVQLGEQRCETPEEFKAWSQNLGHEKALTTFLSYGEVASHRQGEIIRGLAAPKPDRRSDAEEIAEAVLKKLRDAQRTNE